MPRRSASSRLEATLLDCAAVAAAWGALVLVEALVVSLVWRTEFSGAWEIAQARRLAGPLAMAGLGPVSLVMVGWWRVALLARRRARLAMVALAVLGAVAGAALALGISHGRHFASWNVRGPFVGLAAMGGAAAGVLLVPRIAGWVRHPIGLGTLGLGGMVGGWLADVFVLPRLYPAFHVAMLAATLVGAGLVALAIRAIPPRSSRLGRVGAVGMGAIVVACTVRTPHAARALERLSNLRILLVEHAPLLGRAVAATEALHPGDAEKPGPDLPAASPGDVARALDWTGHDLVLLTVDALRADHVSAYGYARPTTPNIDALARKGTLFDAAYCPTPHTSYSLTSMMTGKYLRPLLALGLGEDSETWAEDLRRYGWRTAAFYPPAVFFIDQDRFPRFEGNHLGFEYAKVEFADPALREQQVKAYLDAEPTPAPLFLWVHFFEPHEPYVPHPEHVFVGGATADEDAYDGEIATADDGIGRVVRLVEARRPGAVVMVTADHGEEFGEHGGRYHGTTVYEEQVRVPLAVVGPGVRAGARVESVVQTIDLLPTTLSALGVPRPARLRGRDLGPLLAGKTGGAAVDEGFAFTETDDYALVASGADRLVCERRAAACVLYRPALDPHEKRDFSAVDARRYGELRATLRGIERDHGRYEGGGGPPLPEALRRGMQGDVEAALDVASLLDDADPTIRRKAAEVTFALRAASTSAALRRALARDEDDEVRRWAALALTRLPGETIPPLAESLLDDPQRAWRRRASLVLGERGEGRACEEIARSWSDALPVPGAGRGTAASAAGESGEPPQLAMELADAKELLTATTHARCRGAVPALVRALVDVRARPYVADALGALGDDRAKAPLRSWLASEPYVTTRPHEARALVALGSREWSSGSAEGALDVHASIKAARGPLRLLVWLSDPAATLTGEADGAALHATRSEGEVRVLEGVHVSGSSARIDLHAAAGGVLALWLAGETPHDPPDLIEKPGWRK